MSEFESQALGQAPPPSRFARVWRILGLSSAEIMSARVDKCREVPRLPRAYSVRLVTPDDYERLNSFLEPGKARRLLSSQDLGLVAEAEGSIQAVIWARLGPDEYTADLRRLGMILQIPLGYCWLHNGRAVDPTVRGPWAMVMGRLPGILRERRVHSVCLQVDSANRYSIQCHESLGFRKVGRMTAFQIGRIGVQRLRLGHHQRVGFGRTVVALEHMSA